MNNLKPHSFFHCTPIQIRFNDIDRLEHVNNSVYQQYYDLGKLAYFEEVLQEHMDWNVEGLVLASMTIEFLIPIKLFDKIEVKSKVYEIGNKSLKMKQEIFNHTTGKVASTSKSIMVNFNNAVEKTLPIPSRWRERISDFEKDLLFDLKVQ